MIKKRNKTFKIDKDNYLVYQFPLNDSIAGYEILTTKLGDSFIDFISGVFLNLKDEHLSQDWRVVIKETLKKEDFNSLKAFVKGLKPGEMFEFMSFFINRPDLISRNGKAMDMKEAHEDNGINHLWKLTYEVILFNYFDFSPPSGDTKK